MRRALALLALSSAVLSAPAVADLDSLGGLAQPQFRLLSEDLGAALSYKAILPAEPLGTTGFDLGVEVTAVSLENTVVFALASSGDSINTLYIPKLHLHKGLPFNFDIGAFFSAVPDSNINLWGAELRYAVLAGSATMPAIAVRASYSQLNGVNQLEFSTIGVDVSISKGFAFLTPYIGVGEVWVTSDPDDSFPWLQKESFSAHKIFAGLNMNFTILNIAFEADRTGDTNSYGLKLGWRF
jgi:hypothetical protein